MYKILGGATLQLYQHVQHECSAGTREWSQFKKSGLSLPIYGRRLNWWSKWRAL